MFDSGVLDVALGLTLVFILVSTVCTAIREGIESMLKTRAAYLEYAIRELLHDRKGAGLAKSFFEHPLIHGLFQNDYRAGTLKPTLFARGGSMPSYIPARSFAVALLDIVVRGEDGTQAAGRKLTLALLQQRVDALASPYVRRALRTAIDNAGDDLDRVRQNVELWFDASMDRVSGWYKRSTQAIIFGISLFVVFALNINAITIADALYRDQASRTAAAALAEQLTPGTVDQRAALAMLEGMQLPIGWREGQLDAWLAKLDSITLGAIFLHVVEPLLGLLLTAFGATLGAPFWFDVLNKVMVIRATVKPHEKSAEEGSEDRPLKSPKVSPQPIASPDLQPSAAGEILPHPHLLHADPGNENDADECSAGDDDDPTSDEALPPATGGVR